MDSRYLRQKIGRQKIFQTMRVINNSFLWGLKYMNYS